MINHLGNPQPFFPEGSAVGERPQLGMAHSELGTAEYGGQEDLPETLVTSRPIEGHGGLAEVVDCPPIVALGLIGPPEIAVC